MRNILILILIILVLIMILSACATEISSSENDNIDSNKTLIAQQGNIEVWKIIDKNFGMITVCYLAYNAWDSTSLSIFCK